MLLHNDFAGNAYVTIIDGEMVVMRPDCVDILLASRDYVDTTGRAGTVGMKKVGFAWYEGGKLTGVKPMMFLADEVAHFLAIPDPTASYRGMSWLTPTIREIQADQAAQTHKLKFFENSASPNLAISLQITDPKQFGDFVAKMEESHTGVSNAYKTLYTGAGADVTVIGKDMQQMDFAKVIAAGEVRLAAAAGVHPAVAGLSEGLQGSSLNAGNFGAATRLFSDITLADLWGNAASSLELLVPPPHGGSRLWYDIRDIPFLREDQKDTATIQAAEAQAIRELFMAGFTADSIITAITAKDWTLLVHSGVLSIQVQTPGTTSTKLPSTVDEPPIGPDFTETADQSPAIGALPAAPAPIAGNGKKF
jgi:phage portal protein BeeE